jgi:acyl-coenzyme A thioesterase PaaI-like protein
MDVTKLPFNHLIGLELADPGSDFLVCLPDNVKYTNHLGTVHASALFAVAEAASGLFLLRHLGAEAGLVPVVRRVEAKFRKPGRGRISARALVAPEEASRWSAELARRGRVVASVPIEVVGSDGQTAVFATIDWFIARSAGEVTQRPH